MKVAAVSCAGTKFSLDDTPIEQVLLESAAGVLRSTRNLSGKDIDAVLVSTNDNTKYLSPILSELAGISPKISHSVESLCSSGANAIVSGAAYVASGMADTVLVAGADRFDSPGRILEWDRSRGEFAHPIFWASLFTGAYKRRFGASDEDLASIPAKNHRSARDNPHAYHTMEVGIRDVLGSRELTGDLRLYDCSRPCTGAAAILLASESAAARYTDAPVWIEGIGQKTVSAGFAGNGPACEMESTIRAARDAFSMAGMAPADVDVMELHDAFSVCEPMALEGIGMVQKGAGARFCRELYESGDNHVNPRGGLIGAGHPLGATGVAQANEILMQLQGRASKRQVRGAKVGLVHNMSAAATSSSILVFGS